MARITVEDCLENVDNRFELVMVASKRARQLAVDNRAPLVNEDSDKATVIALREIAEGMVTNEILAEVEPDLTDTIVEPIIEVPAEKQAAAEDSDEDL